LNGRVEPTTNRIVDEILSSNNLIPEGSPFDVTELQDENGNPIQL
jgi:hypothetical protein